MCIVHNPETSGVMEPSGRIVVLSTNESPGPRVKIPPTAETFLIDGNSSKRVKNQALTVCLMLWHLSHPLRNTDKEVKAEKKEWEDITLNSITNCGNGMEPTNILLWNSTPRILRGWNSLGIGLPLGWGFSAVPAGGFWAGVK